MLLSWNKYWLKYHCEEISAINKFIKSKGCPSSIAMRAAEDREHHQKRARHHKSKIEKLSKGE